MNPQERVINASSKYINSMDCLSSPPFLNPHQALIDAYWNYSFIRSSARKYPLPTKEKKLKKLHYIYDYSNPDNTFKISIHKSRQGLGFSICGGTGVSENNTFSQLIRIKKLYPLHSALEFGKLQPEDVVLSVNDVNMVGLSKTEAMEVLRTTPTVVILEIFRPSKSLIPVYSTFMEIEITLIKKGGSLGFSIFRKETKDLKDGFYVKALVREPAISDGRIQPGDKILKVNGTDISMMSQTEAIEFIRNAPSSVTLKLFCAHLSTTPSDSEKEYH